MQEGLRVLHHGIVQIHVQGRRTKEDEGNKTIRKIKYCLHPWVALAQNKCCWRRGETEEKRVRRLSSDGSGRHGDGADGVRSTKHVYTLWRSSHLKKKKNRKKLGQAGLPYGVGTDQKIFLGFWARLIQIFLWLPDSFWGWKQEVKMACYHKKVV